MNPWKELEIERGASKEEVTAAFRRLALIWHPDRCRKEGAEEKMKRINRAFDMLMNPERVPEPVIRTRESVHVRTFGQIGGFTSPWFIGTADGMTWTFTFGSSSNTPGND